MNPLDALDHIQGRLADRNGPDTKEAFNIVRAYISDTQGSSTGFWDGLGMNADLPMHMPMPVTIDNEGPAEPQDTHHYICWCGNNCMLNNALMAAFRCGIGRVQFE